MSASKRSSARPIAPVGRSPLGRLISARSTASRCTGSNSSVIAARSGSIRSASTPNTARTITSSVISRVRRCMRIGLPSGQLAMSRRVASAITSSYSRMRSP